MVIGDKIINKYKRSSIYPTGKAYGYNIVGFWNVYVPDIETISYMVPDENSINNRFLKTERGKIKIKPPVRNSIIGYDIPFGLDFIKSNLAGQEDKGGFMLSRQGYLCI
ncbi:MAG: hypothetical protein LUE26_00580 [Alistipes sp.]|nr:hypothetical protein [Alistipes sp.]